MLLSKILIMQFKKHYQKNSVGEELEHYLMVYKIVEMELKQPVDVLVLILREVWHYVIKVVNK